MLFFEMNKIETFITKSLSSNTFQIANHIATSKNFKFCVRSQASDCVMLFLKKETIRFGHFKGNVTIDKEK